jgi:hypothetical protein
VLYWSLNGGVAQLGERSVRNAEVRGSNPLTSTVCPLTIPPTQPQHYYLFTTVVMLCATPLWSAILL